MVSVLAVLLAMTGYETALLVVAASFISVRAHRPLVIRARGRRFLGASARTLRAICGVFFLAQMTAVLLLAENGEADESGHETTSGEETETTGDDGDRDDAGDAIAGRAVFQARWMRSCHTLSDADATGQIGPNLDDIKPSTTWCSPQVTDGGGAMPPFKGNATDTQIDDVAAYVSSVSAGT